MRSIVFKTWYCQDYLIMSEQEKTIINNTITEQSQQEYKEYRLSDLKKNNITCYPYFFETTRDFSDFIEPKVTMAVILTILSESPNSLRNLSS